MEKMTKKDYFNAVLDLIDTMSATDPTETFGKRKVTAPDMRTFIEHEMELLNKKNTTRSNKPTKGQVENANLAEKVLENMEIGKSYTVSEIQTNVVELAKLSNQRATAVVRSLVRTGAVIRNEVKGKAYFQKV